MFAFLQSFTAKQFFSTPFLVHGGLICIALCLSVRLSLDQIQTRKSFISQEAGYYTLTAKAILKSFLVQSTVTLIKVYNTGRWAHINVKLLHFVKLLHEVMNGIMYHESEVV